jgi:hypothetical protein
MSLPSTMSGVRLIKHGDPEMLVWSEVIPVLGPSGNSARAEAGRSGE